MELFHVKLNRQDSRGGLGLFASLRSVANPLDASGWAYETVGARGETQAPWRQWQGEDAGRARARLGPSPLAPVAGGRSHAPGVA